MVTNHSPAKLGNVVLKVNEVLRLLMSGHIVEMDVFVPPLEVVDDPLISQLLFHDENVLEKVDYPFLDVEVVELRNHSFLVFQVSFVLIDQSIALVDHVPDVVKYCTVGAHVQLGKSLG